MLPMVNFDRELSRFIAAGRLHCKIDKVGEIVETNRPDSKNYQYQVWYAFLLDITFIIRSWRDSTYYLHSDFRVCKTLFIKYQT